MTYLCPLKNRECQCDPELPKDHKLHPCALCGRIAKLFRLIGSSIEGEAISAATGLRRIVQAEGLSFNDLAILIENCDGRIENKKYSDSDCDEIYNRARTEALEELALNPPEPAEDEYYDADGQPKYGAMALWCQKHPDLEARHHDFIDKMASTTMYREPTPAQAKYLVSLFVGLGSGRWRR